MSSIKGYLTTQQVADKYGLEIHQVRYAIRIGKIKTHRIGWTILIKEKDLPKEWPVQEKVRRVGG